MRHVLFRMSQAPGFFCQLHNGEQRQDAETDEIRQQQKGALCCFNR